MASPFASQNTKRIVLRLTQFDNFLLHTACTRALFNFLRGQAAEEPSDPASSQWESNAPKASTSRPAVHLKAAAAHVTSAVSATAALSRHLWASVNPGYAPTDTSKQLSVQRADYVWDAAEVRQCAVSSAGSLTDRS